MKVTLAVPYEDKKPDATIEVDDHVGKTLIAQGRARPASSGTPSKEQKAADQVAQEVAHLVAEAEAGASPATDTTPEG